MGLRSRLRARRRERGRVLLRPLLDASPDAAAGWQAASPQLRELYLEYAGGAWTAGMRRARAQDTALWAASGELDEHVQRLSWSDVGHYYMNGPPG